jgi:hypothetical protein
MQLDTSKKKCKATTRAKTGCGNYPLPGQQVCRMHGGKAPAALAAAERRLLAQQITANATATLAHEGITAVDDPIGELGKLAGAAQAMMHALGARVNALQSVEHFDLKSTPQLRVEVELYERAMDRTHRLLDSLVKHGYAERQVTIAENEAMLVAGVIRRVLAGLGLTNAQRDQAQLLLAEEFRALEEATK